MIIIAGLGNPGEKFKNTPHNIGFRIIEEFARKNEFPEFKFSKKTDSLISEGLFEKKKIILLKPQTFMNNSGIAIKKIIKNKKCEKGDLLIVHDEADILLGKMKIAENRGSAGHKGVESIMRNLGNKEFIRLRIGIGRKDQKEKGKLENFVIKNFRKDEKEDLKIVIEKAVQLIEIALEEGIEKAKSKLPTNKKIG
jgi:PTH1 family peptidyl-tRNA hydrolase